MTATASPSAVLDRFLALLPSWKANGSGFVAQCPAHDDRKASLTIHEGKDGRVLLKCHAGCDTASIVAAVGMKLSDLYPPKQKSSRPRAKIAATYEYQDSSGKVVFETVRYDPKDFKQRRPDGLGSWIYSLKGVTLVPYRLPQLLAAPVTDAVYITEGEKDADRLTSLGLVATSAPLGAGNWNANYNIWFAGRHVVILPDNDDPGRSHAVDIARNLYPIAASVKIVALAGVPAKGDVSDWIDAGNTVNELVKLSEVTPDWTPPPPAKPMTLDEVHRVFKKWLYLPTTDPLDVVLGTYAANLGDGNAVWTLLVGVSGSGKTELLMPLDGLDDTYVLSTFTESSFLSGTSTVDRTKTSDGGLLREIGTRGVLILKDFTSVLSMNRDARSTSIAALREIYDGKWVRRVGTDGGMKLEWKGKVGLVGASTPAIDNHHEVMSTLGERFVYYRMPELTDVDEDSVIESAMDLTDVENTMRDDLANAVKGLFLHAQGKPDSRSMSKDERRFMRQLVKLSARGRAPVTREPTTQRIITNVIGAEVPTRVSMLLTKLFAGMVFIGVERRHAWTIIRKIGLDSIPRLRMSALELLFEQHKKGSGPVPTRDVGRTVNRPTTTTRYALEELEAYKLVVRTQGSGSGTPDLWELSQMSIDYFEALQVLPSSEHEMSEKGYHLEDLGRYRDIYNSASIPPPTFRVQNTNAVSSSGTGQSATEQNVKTDHLPRLKVGDPVWVDVQGWRINRDNGPWKIAGFETRIDGKSCVTFEGMAIAVEADWCVLA